MMQSFILMAMITIIWSGGYSLASEGTPFIGTCAILSEWGGSAPNADYAGTSRNRPYGLPVDVCIITRHCHGAFAERMNQPHALFMRYGPCRLFSMAPHGVLVEGEGL